MKTYLLQLSVGSVTPRWEYEFTMPSDDMAQGYAEKLVKNDPVARVAMRVDLFNRTDDHVVCSWEICTEVKLMIHK